MDAIRRLAAILMALSLALPLRSCTYHGYTTIDYAITLAGDSLTKVWVATVHLLPLGLLFVRRRKVVGLVLGVLTSGFGLFLVPYFLAAGASKLLIGWYTYSTGALAHLAASIALLVRIGLARLRPSNGVTVR